jgi:DNA repair exonuclease SbcCD ATPase subunit
MKIQLESIKLTNFKKIRSFSINFHSHITNIYGKNEDGKTSLMDAFLWVLFDKDSTDRKDFSIKTLDENNVAYPRLDHEVEVVLNVDGNTITLRKCLNEKWVKRKGSTETEFTGHETSYFWNDVPMKKEVYQAKISELLNEQVFKLITNTTYFNALKWEDRRATLISIAGKINDADIAAGNPAFEALIKHIAGKKSIKEYKSEIAASKKKIKDQLDLLPSRISEAKLALPEEKDYTLLAEQAAGVQVDIDGIDGLLSNKSLAYQDHQNNLNTLITKRQGLRQLMNDIEFTAKNKVQQNKQARQGKINEEKNALSAKNNERTTFLGSYNSSIDRKTALVKEQGELRIKWGNINDEKLEFKEGEFCCPACKREFEAADVDAKKTELTNNFNNDKSTRLMAITNRGAAITKELEDLEIKISNITADGIKLKSEIEVIDARIIELQKEHDRLSADEIGEQEKEIAGSETYQKCRRDIVELEEQINTPFQAEDNSALVQRKKDLIIQLNQLQNQMASKGQREQQLKRVQELEDQEGTMAQQLATLEGTEYTILQFEKAQMDELENRINDRFKIVKFKMFKQNINGGEEPCCITLVNGVPYPDVNTAGKIQAGLDIINTLSSHYGVQAPVWVDNRESVTNLPETECQLINLIVNEHAPKLTLVKPVPTLEMEPA